MSITVMKQALEALELNNSTWKALADSGDAGWWLAEEQDHYKQTEQAITSLRQAIAEAEKQEPVKQFAQESFMQLWQSYCDKKMEVEDLKEQLETLTQPEQEPWVCECGADSYLACKCSIKSPPQRQPLTDEMVVAAARELCKIHAGECQVDEQDTWTVYSDQFKRDAEAMLKAAHGIKGEA